MNKFVDFLCAVTLDRFLLRFELLRLFIRGNSKEVSRKHFAMHRDLVNLRQCRIKAVADGRCTTFFLLNWVTGLHDGQINVLFQ